MAKMKRCLAQLSLSGRWGTEHLWPGLEVNFERELAPGFTVAAAIAGRENCFEDVEPIHGQQIESPADAPQLQPAAPVDLDPETFVTAVADAGVELPESPKGL
jgi:hypothetical protein